MVEQRRLTTYDKLWIFLSFRFIFSVGRLEIHTGAVWYLVDFCLLKRICYNHCSFNLKCIMIEIGCVQCALYILCELCEWDIRKESMHASRNIDVVGAYWRGETQRGGALWSLSVCTILYYIFVHGKDRMLINIHKSKKVSLCQCNKYG